MIINKQIQQFITIADAGSFSLAAKILYMSQPTLTKQVRALGESIGFSITEA